MARIVPEGGWGSRLKPFKTPREKAPSHLVFIKRLPCVCCAVEQGGMTARQADDPMHIRSGSMLHGKEPTGGGQKPHDRWVLPGCRQHHDQQHGMNEMAFWRRYGIDAHLLALVLWSLTGDDFAALEVIGLHAVAAVSKRSPSRSSGGASGARRPPEPVSGP